MNETVLWTLIGLGGGAVISWLFFVIGRTSTSPRLVINGGGGGSVPGGQISYGVRIRNSATFMGIFKVDRPTATHLRAHLEDAVENEVVGRLLHWQDNNGNWVDRVNLQCGESASLPLVSKLEDAPHYAIIEIDGQRIVDRDADARFHDRRHKFRLVIMDAADRRTAFPLTVEHRARRLYIQAHAKP